MYYAYILKSQKTGRYYYGSTKDISHRLNTHNSGKVRSTKSGVPWEIYYFEKFDSRSDAVKREMFFKSVDGYRWLRKEGVI